MKAFSKSLVESSKVGMLRDSREANLPDFDNGMLAVVAGETRG